MELSKITGLCNTLYLILSKVTWGGEGKLNDKTRFPGVVGGRGWMVIATTRVTQNQRAVLRT